MSGRYDMDHLKSMLVAQLERMIDDHLPEAQRMGRDWCVGDLDGKRGKSLVIWHNGAWKDHANPALRGDVLALFAALYCGAPVVNHPVIEKAAAFVGLDPEAEAPSPDELAAREKQRAAARSIREKADAEKAEKKRRYWFARWLKATPCRADDPAWCYLRDARGLDPAAFERGGKMPGAIRFAPDWPFWAESQREPTHHYPALVAQIWGPLDPLIHGPGKRACLAVHATYLEQGLDGNWRAQVDIDKDGKCSTRRRVYAKAGGGLIPLWKPDPRLHFTNAPADASLVLCEGIEDGLTIAQAVPEMWVAAAYSIGNLANLRSPAETGFAEIVIAADRDWGKPHCAKTIQRVQHRVILGGRTCRVVYSETGKDFNDWVRASEATPRVAPAPTEKETA